MRLLILTVSLALASGSVLQGDITIDLKPPPAAQEIPKDVPEYASPDQDATWVGIQEQQQQLLQHHQIPQMPQIEQMQHQQQQYTGVIQDAQEVLSDQGLLNSYQPSAQQVAQIPQYKNSVLSGQAAQYQSGSLTTGAKFEQPAIALTNTPSVLPTFGKTSSGTGHKYTTVTFRNGLVGLGHTVDYNAIGQSQNQLENQNYYSSSQGSQKIIQNVEHQQAVLPSHSYSAPEKNSLSLAPAYDTISVSQSIPTIPIKVPQPQSSQVQHITEVSLTTPVKVPTHVDHYSQPLPAPVEVPHANFERPAPQYTNVPVEHEQLAVKVPEYHQQHDFDHHYSQPLNHHNHHSIDLSNYNHFNLHNQKLPYSSAQFNFHKDFNALNLQLDKNHHNFNGLHKYNEISDPEIYLGSLEDIHDHTDIDTFKDFHTTKENFKPISQSIHPNYNSLHFNYDGHHKIPHYHGSNHHSSSILSGLTGGLSSKLRGGHGGRVSLHSGNNHGAAASYGGDHKFPHGLGNTHTSFKHGYHTSDLEDYKPGHKFSGSLGFSTNLHSQRGSGGYASGYTSKYLGSLSADYGKHSFSLPNFKNYPKSFSTSGYHKVPETLIQQFDSKDGYKY